MKTFWTIFFTNVPKSNTFPDCCHLVDFKSSLLLKVSWPSAYLRKSLLIDKFSAVCRGTINADCNFFFFHFPRNTIMEIVLTSVIVAEKKSYRNINFARKRAHRPVDNRSQIGFHYFTEDSCTQRIYIDKTVFSVHVENHRVHNGTP